MSTAHLTILFADICDSTQLYEQLGDEKARDLIAECLNSIQQVAERHAGTLVKTIGDELLIRFNLATKAIDAACEMQRTSRQHSVSQNDDLKRLDIRIGLHCGPAIIEDNDVFGDSVNIAARLVAMSKPGQILTSSETIKQLPPLRLNRCRHIDRAPVKGKSEDLDIYEIFDDEDEVTQMTVSAIGKRHQHATLFMKYKDNEYTFHNDQSQFTIGRSEVCDLIIDEDLASRQHLTLENRRGKLFIVDISTNGTWIRSEKGKEIFLRRDEMQLPSSGEFSFGRSFRENPEHILHFRIEQEVTK